MIKHSSAKRILQAVIPAVALLLSASLWAADAASSQGRGSMDIDSPVNVAGTQLQSGKYRVEWAGTGDQVEVKIFKGSKLAVSTHASLMEDRTSYDHVSYGTAENGTKSLTQIFFGKEKCSLRLENGASARDGQQAAK